MVHTMKDYSSKYRQNKVYGSIDVAELAVRSSRFFSVDRRGNVVWWDDNDNDVVLNWKVVADTTGTAVLSADRASTGSTSVKVTTAASANDTVAIVKVFSASFSHRSGIEMCYCVVTGQPFVDLYLLGYSGDYYYEAGFRHDFSTAKIYYEDNTASFVELTKVDPFITDREHWLPVKLVADWGIQEYIRLIFAGTEYDLTGIPLYKVVSTEKQHLRPQIKTTASAASACVVYYDNFILTQNE